MTRGIIVGVIIVGGIIVVAFIGGIFGGIIFGVGMYVGVGSNGHIARSGVTTGVIIRSEWFNDVLAVIVSILDGMTWPSFN